MFISIFMGFYCFVHSNNACQHCQNEIFFDDTLLSFQMSVIFFCFSSIYLLANVVNESQIFAPKPADWDVHSKALTSRVIWLLGNVPVQLLLPLKGSGRFRFSEHTERTTSPGGPGHRPPDAAQLVSLHLERTTTVRGGGSCSI